MAADYKPNVVPDLAAIAADPARVSGLPLEAVPALRGKLAELDTLLSGRLLQSGNSQGQTKPDGDRPLSAKQAAAKLGASIDYLYRHSSKLPFTVRMGGKVLFSEAGIERYIRQRMGR